MNNQYKGTANNYSLASRLLSAWSATDSPQTRIGLIRSLLIYYGLPGRRSRLSRFYRQFIGPNDLAFDVGAHVGNRIQAWRDIGARVVGVEPQPACMHLLHKWYSIDPDVALVDAAIGAKTGEETLHISLKTPTVTTLSVEWQEAVQQVDSFSDVRWDQQVTVQVLTMEQLIEEHGPPVFCKIDVEGYEYEVLKGLKQPIQALSLEYIPATPATTLACIDHLSTLGDYRFNWSLGESHTFESRQWVDAKEIQAIAQAQDPNANSGDLYARLYEGN